MGPGRAPPAARGGSEWETPLGLAFEMQPPSDERVVFTTRAWPIDARCFEASEQKVSLSYRFPVRREVLRVLVRNRSRHVLRSKGPSNLSLLFWPGTGDIERHEMLSVGMEGRGTLSALAKKAGSLGCLAVQT